VEVPKGSPFIVYFVYLNKLYQYIFQQQGMKNYEDAFKKHVVCELYVKRNTIKKMKTMNMAVVPWYARHGL
jgi:hypothetical protein